MIVKILNDGQYPGTVQSDVGAGLTAPLVIGLWEGQAQQGLGRSKVACRGRGHWGGWGISYLPASAKINSHGSARGVGQTGYSRLPLGSFSYIYVKGTLLKKVK